MEKSIINLIDKKAAIQLGKLTPIKRKTYRTLLYAGAQIVENGRSVKEIAAEIGYSESGTSKLAKRWIKLMKEGDVTVNLIVNEIQKNRRNKRFGLGNLHETETNDIPQTNVPRTEGISYDFPKETLSNLRGQNVLGFYFSPLEILMEKEAIRSAILFFQSYGKGSGTAAVDSEKTAKRWLPLETAALYCGCNEEIIRNAGKNGTIERRVYKRHANRCYYEYDVEGLDKFIHDNQLL